MRRTRSNPQLQVEEAVPAVDTILPKPRRVSTKTAKAVSAENNSKNDAGRKRNLGDLRAESAGGQAFTTPSPVCSQNMEAAQTLSLKRKKAMFTDVDITKSISENLPRNVIGKIFFSGYFTTSCVASKFMTLSKDINDIGKSNFLLADMRLCRISEARIARVLKQSFKNLVFLDLSYTTAGDATAHAIESCLSRTLQGLSLRGTNLTSDGMSSIGKLTELRILDISKTERRMKFSIDYSGFVNLKNLTKLELLNLGGLYPMESLFKSASKTWPKLTYLSLQCCSSLTDKAAAYFSSMRLYTLDISGTSMTEKGITALCSERFGLRFTLETLSCCHLRGTDNILQTCLNELPNLVQLDMRGIMGKSESLQLKQMARSTLDLAIFDPEDQPSLGGIKVLKNIDYYFQLEVSEYYKSS